MAEPISPSAFCADPTTGTLYPPYFRGTSLTASRFPVCDAYTLQMPHVTPEEAQAYAMRWRLVHEVEVAELQRTSMETKLHQLSAVMASRDLFGPDPEREADVRAVRERWARLRQALGG